ncbi:hypothetical protein C8F01DRAFT_1084044 [Mycena amicta]|nr:hypothetical protein C8F01DRAFT_1084044 [Mycena amicta]
MTAETMAATSSGRSTGRNTLYRICGAVDALVLDPSYVARLLAATETHFSVFGERRASSEYGAGAADAGQSMFGTADVGRRRRSGSEEASGSSGSSPRLCIRRRQLTASGACAKVKPYAGSSCASKHYQPDNWSTHLSTEEELGSPNTRRIPTHPALQNRHGFSGSGLRFSSGSLAVARFSSSGSGLAAAALHDRGFSNRGFSGSSGGLAAAASHRWTRTVAVHVRVRDEQEAMGNALEAAGVAGRLCEEKGDTKQAWLDRDWPRLHCPPAILAVSAYVQTGDAGAQLSPRKEAPRPGSWRTP